MDRPKILITFLILPFVKCNSNVVISTSDLLGHRDKIINVRMLRRSKIITNPEQKEANVKYLPEYQVGKKRTPQYNPQYGYEQYWADGEWIHGPENQDKKNAPPRETCSPFICPEHYKWQKMPVCAHAPPDIDFRFYFLTYCDALEEMCKTGKEFYIIGDLQACTGTLYSYGTPLPKGLYAGIVKGPSSYIVAK